MTLGAKNFGFQYYKLLLLGIIIVIIIMVSRCIQSFFKFYIFFALLPPSRFQNYAKIFV